QRLRCPEAFADGLDLEHAALHLTICAARQRSAPRQHWLSGGRQAIEKLWTWQFSPGHIRVSRDGRLLFVNFGNEIVQFTLAP
ncbi:MAG TPA: hypothetical protein VJV78_37295, partial [Polyangiales bacterium]|nr:hypothetical protein [Polyangiales bacterium]